MLISYLLPKTREVVTCRGKFAGKKRSLGNVRSEIKISAGMSCE